MTLQYEGPRALARKTGPYLFIGPRACNGSLESTTGRLKTPYVCLSCQRSSSRRTYASAATAVKEDIPQVSGSDESSQNPVTTSSIPRPVYKLQAGIVLSRPPQITRDLHPFESAYFFYQRRLNERLALPFTRYFYFKKGTPADIEWKRKQKERITPARDIGLYHAYGKEAWNDELLVDAKESETEHQVQALLSDAESPAIGGGPEAGVEVGAEQAASKRVEVEKPMSRVTEADKSGDEKSLNRLLQRSLYLLVQNSQGQWQFPSASLAGNEGFAKAAERIISETGGPNMNTWIVGHVPIGHFARDFESLSVTQDKKKVQLGEKVFFMKGRIMAGQVNLGLNKLGLSDFRWLAKEEIQKLVTPDYWSMTEMMLTDR